MNPELLAEIQEAASVAGLAHVFGDAPFPRAEVLARWQASDELVFVEDDLGFVAVDPPWLDALYVRPEAWGTGVAARLHDLAVGELRERGVGRARLWVLEANVRGRRFYERRGWYEDGTTREVPFPPHPIDLGYSLQI